MKFVSGLKNYHVTDTGQCSRCGMLTSGPKEFHPFSACLMFKACGNSNTVRANLKGVVEFGRLVQRADITTGVAMNDTVLVRRILKED